MHTDEYEISLSRELKVCGSTILKIKRLLASLEKKYEIETKTFVKEYLEGGMSGDEKDFSLWVRNYDELQKWEERKRQYEQLLRLMKV